ncbi:MAG: ABC transporter substrate-binding protein [Rhizobiaceae bacterium]|nr:ABC transporter substrate-binding protein [Rhizobiaceae bacterium]
MNKRQKLLSTVAAVASITTGLLMAGAAASADLHRGGVLTMGRPDEPLTLDPFIPSDNGSIFAIAQVCEPLILADKAGTGLEPGLASSWTISPDGLTYVFTLRDGVVFSDGKPLTPEDVIFSLNKQMDPSSSFGFAFAAVKTIEKTDDKHVTITLKTPYVPILSALSLYAASIVEKAAYEASPEAFGLKPVCTGPFTVDTYERGSQVVLKANPKYWAMGDDGKPLPYLDKIVMKYMPDGNSRILGLKNGDLDVALQLPLSQASSVKATEGLVLETAPSYALDYIYLNHAKKPLDDKRIRLALNYATNHDALMKAVYFGFGEVPNSFTPKVNYWSADVKAIPYDPDKAAQLVKEANYDGTPIELMVSSGNSTQRQTASILQAAWQKAGLKVNIVQYEGATAGAMMRKGDYQARVNLISSDINDSDEIATLQTDYYGSSHSFFTWYKNDDVIALLNQARGELDTTKRAALYAKVQDVVYNDGYSVPLNFVPFINGYRSKVENWQNIAVGWWWLKTTRIAP